MSSGKGRMEAGRYVDPNNTVLKPWRPDLLIASMHFAGEVV
jgi:hypothetical protein